MVRSSIFDPHEVVLQASLAQHGHHPPQEERARLSGVTSLPRKKIWDWFNKHRERAKPIDQRRPRKAKRARDARAAIAAAALTADAMQEENDNTEDDAVEAAATVSDSGGQLPPDVRAYLQRKFDEDIDRQLEALSGDVGVAVGRPAAEEATSVAGKRSKEALVSKARKEEHEE